MRSPLQPLYPYDEGLFCTGFPLARHFPSPAVNWYRRQRRVPTMRALDIPGTTVTRRKEATTKPGHDDRLHHARGVGPMECGKIASIFLSVSNRAIWSAIFFLHPAAITSVILCLFQCSLNPAVWSWSLLYNLWGLGLFLVWSPTVGWPPLRSDTRKSMHLSARRSIPLCHDIPFTFSIPCVSDSL